MLYAKKASDLLYEAAAAEFMDPDVSEEVKDTVTDITDILTNNVDTVDPEDKETNNAVLTAESCAIFETSYGYAVDVRDIMRICEEEEAMTGEAPAASDVAADVAEENEVDTDELVIVAPADVAQEIVEACLYEAKCGKSGKATKKAKKLGEVLGDLKAKGFKIKTKKSKKK